MEVGYAKREITPEIGVKLAGNGPDYRSEGIHDPLYARALVVQENNRRVALVSCDLIGIEREFTENVRLMLRKGGQAVYAHVFISCTHTHNGPTTRFNRWPQLEDRDDAYLRRIEEAVTHAIEEAANNLQECSIKFGRGLAHENFNRRLITPNGVAHFYNPRTLQQNPEFEGLTGGVTDPELTALQFLDKAERPILTLVQYAAHPLTIGIHADVISRDYCGRLVDLLEEHYQAPAIFFQGACGDLHNKGLFAGFGRMEEMAAALATESKRILDDSNLPRCHPSFYLATRRIALEVDPSRLEAGRWNPDFFREDYEYEMAAFSLGPITFVSLPGELCCEPGLQIKANSPFSQTWLLYNCNACAGYLLYPRGYIEGGYEANANCFRPSACLMVVEKAIELCRELKADISVS